MMQQQDLPHTIPNLPVEKVRYYHTTDSTNTQALAWAEIGAEDGSLVIAENQTAGRGRNGRHWVTTPGGGLAFSLILIPRPNELAYMGLYSPLAALGITQVLTDRYHLSTSIKYPNDILLNRQKIGGILVEANWLGTIPQYVVLGIGLNIAYHSIPKTDQLMYPATCLEAALGHPVDRWSLLGEIIQEIDTWRSMFGSDTFMGTWQNRLAFKEEMVTISQEQNKPALYGKIKGINQDGSLCLETQSGIQSIVIGDILLRPVGSTKL